MICKYCLPFCGLSFHFLDGIVCSAKVLNFDGVQFIYFFLLSFVVLVSHLRRLYLIQSTYIYSYIFSSKSFLVLALTFKCIVHCEFIFLYGVRMGSNFILLHVDILATFKNVILYSSSLLGEALSQYVKSIWNTC